MAEVLECLLVSFIDAMNEGLAKPFTILDNFQSSWGMAYGKAPRHDDVPIEQDLVWEIAKSSHHGDLKWLL